MSEQLREILKLSVPERILLVEAIWDSIADENKTIDLSDDQKELINQRFEQYKSNPDDVIPWNDVKAALSKGK